MSFRSKVTPPSGSTSSSITGYSSSSRTLLPLSNQIVNKRFSRNSPAPSSFNSGSPTSQLSLFAPSSGSVQVLSKSVTSLTTNLNHASLFSTCKLIVFSPLSPGLISEKLKNLFSTPKSVASQSPTTTTPLNKIFFI